MTPASKAERLKAAKAEMNAAIVQCQNRVLPFWHTRRCFESVHAVEAIEAEPDEEGK